MASWQPPRARQARRAANVTMVRVAVVLLIVAAAWKWGPVRVPDRMDRGSFNGEAKFRAQEGLK